MKPEGKHNKSYHEELQQLLSTWQSSRYADYLRAWDLARHDVFDEAKRPKIQVRSIDSRGKEQVEWQEVNRIGLALEQDITNIHTSFCVGLAPDLRAEAKDKEAEQLLEVIEATESRCRLDFLNKRIVRSWLSECMVAEYWYATPAEEDFYPEGIGGKVRLKVDVWSPFSGDILIPQHNRKGELVRFLRSYEVKDEEGNSITRVMDITRAEVVLSERQRGEFVEIERYRHGFDKLPVIYMKRAEPLCQRITPIRHRLEVLQSNYADCVDYNFAPKLIAKGGEIQGIWKSGRSQLVRLMGESSLEYLTWQQSPESIRLELEMLYDQAYQLTNTPRISLKDMQGAGNGFSGESFRYVFMGTHMAVRNHEEVIGEYLSRRYSFLRYALGLLTGLPTLGLRLDPTLRPYMIEADEGVTASKDEETQH